MRKPTSSSQLTDMHPEVGLRYRQMREQILAECGLDELTRDLVIVTGYAARRMDQPFQVHCAQMLRRGISAQRIRAALLLTLGSSAAIGEVVHCYRLLDAVLAELAEGASPPATPAQSAR